MSWAPVTWWQIQCDGTRGMRGAARCEERWTFENEDRVPEVVTFDEQRLPLCQHVLVDAGEDGWMLRADGRALCPAHVAAHEAALAAQIDGLPFGEVST